MSRGRLVIALIVAVISILGYYGSSVFNPITQEKQHVAGITPEQEVALGLQAAPEMAQQFGGEDPDPAAQQMVREVGQRVQTRSRASQTQFCHLICANDASAAIWRPFVTANRTPRPSAYLGASAMAFRIVTERRAARAAATAFSPSANDTRN